MTSRALVRFEHDNALRVFGGPGAGKTRSLVDLLTRHVDDGDFELHDGIIVSFTRAAAHGIAQRVNPHGEPGRYHCTLHALCKRYFGIEAEVAEAHIRDFFKERGIEYRGRAADIDDLMVGQGSDRSVGALLQAFWTLCRNRLMTITSGKGAFPPEPEVTEWWADDRLEKLYADYEAWKMANGYVDFCMDEETEVLTRRGWVNGYDIQEGDEVRSIDPGSWATKWSPVTGVYRRVGDARMVHMTNQVVDALVTPNHRWLTVSGDGERRWRTTETLSTWDRIARAAPPADRPEKAVPDAFVELVAWWYTEGYVKSDRRSGQIGQSHKVNPEFVSRIERCLLSLYGEPGNRRAGPAHEKPLWNLHRAEKRGMSLFLLSERIVEDLERHAPGKVPSLTFLDSLTAAQLDLFIETSLDADGHRRKNAIVFAQKNPLRAEAFALACILAGRPITQGSIRTGKNIGMTSVTVNRVALSLVPDRTPVDYRGLIWCPTVAEHHNFLARRHGRIYYTGNTDMLEYAVENPPRRRWPFFVMDECFPAGTLVETPDGPVPIEQIAWRPDRPWSVLSSVDGGRTVQWGHVQAAYQTPPSTRLVRIGHEYGTLTCTANHPLWVVGRGWVPAGLVAEGDALRVVRPAHSPASEVLLDDLRQGELEQPALAGARSRTATQDQPAHERGSGRTTEPHGQSGQPAEDVENAEGSRSQAADPQGQWTWAFAGADAIVRGVDRALQHDALAPRVCALKWSRGAQGRITDTLQAGYRGARPNAGHRGGRLLSHDPGPPATGSPEDRRAVGARVVSVEVLEPGDPGGPRQRHGPSLGCDVFTLSVSTGSYFADGVLAKNCQDSTPLQWRVAQAFASCADVVYLAGDDDQAIYQWAGATPYEFLEANVALDDVLAINHRSGGTLVTAATRLINRNKVRKWKPIEAARDGGEITYAGTDQLPLPRMGEHTFVMARAKYLNEPLVEELERKGFPFVDRSGSGGVNGKASEAFHRFLRLQAGHAISLQEWRLLAAQIPTDRRPWLVRGAKARLDRLEPQFRESTYITVADLPDYGATETLVAAIRAGEVAVLEAVDQRRLGYLKEVERRYGPAFLNEHKAAEICVVGSIHAFKGLECDRAIVNTAMPPRAAVSAETDVEAERRVAYVAASRAKEEITYYTGGSVRSWEEIL